MFTRRYRGLRISILLLLLAAAALSTWLGRLHSTSWQAPLWLAVYPINGDGSAAVEAYIDRLGQEDLAAIERFMAEEAERYGIGLIDPLVVKLGPTLSEGPPLPPPGGSPLAVAWWSLKLRWWSMQVDGIDEGTPDMKMFVFYHEAADRRMLDNSLGLEKGMVGIVHAFAQRQMTPTNNVVLTHEMLHLLGASDKYDPATNLPRYPEGYAEPERRPRHPQQWAEIMGGRIPLDAGRAEMPERLAQTLIGEQTAREINWLP